MEQSESDVAVVPEDDCEDVAQSKARRVEDAEGSDLAELDEVASAALEASDDLPVDLLAGGLGPRGGSWGGAQHPVDRAWAIGRANRLQWMSRKRTSGSSGSDHHTSQTRSDAIDMSNGSRPTPEMDRTARQLAALLGHPNWQGGVLNWRGNGYRVQLLYKTNVGGNHYNHVHVGVRVGG